MHIDVITLFYMTCGVSFVAALHTLWERRLKGSNGSEFLWWASGYAVIGLGCFLRIQPLPSAVSLALANLGVMLGYAFIFIGIARFMAVKLPNWCGPLLAASLVIWLGWIWKADIDIRTAYGSIIVAALSLGAASLLRERPGQPPYPSQQLAKTLFAIHGSIYAFRALAVVLGSSTLAQFNGVVMIAIMVEGLLWAATGPAALLTLVRERSEHRLFSASETDFLTGLDNRRAFSRRGQSLLDDTAERGACCNLLVFDLDHFKSINDRNGHQTGDEVLKIFARILQSEAQPQDIVARLGGEEFALLLAGDQTRRPETVAAAVSTRLREATLAFPGFAEPVTVSAGLASSGDCDVGLDRLVALADAALYRAKFNGRNRLERAEPVCGAPVTSGLRPAVA